MYIISVVTFIYINQISIMLSVIFINIKKVLLLRGKVLFLKPTDKIT